MKNNKNNVRRGHCTNYTNCTLADNGEIIEIDKKDDFVCPLCGKELVEETPKSKKWIWIVLCVIIIAILVCLVPKRCENDLPEVSIDTVFNKCGDTIFLKGSDTIKVSSNNRQDTNYNKNGDTLIINGCDTIIKRYQTPVKSVELYSIKVLSSNASQGSVSGGGSFTIGKTTNITATPQKGFIFSHWNQGNTRYSDKATCTIEVTGDMTFTAFFKKKVSVPQRTDSPIYGNYTGPRNSYGEPHGRGGSVIITTEYRWKHLIFSPGDKITNTTYENGTLRHGKVIQKDGNTFDI